MGNHPRIDQGFPGASGNSLDLSSGGPILVP
jgi:hypothetical protein